MKIPPRHGPRALATSLGLGLGLGLSALICVTSVGCAKQQQDTDAPDELELPPEKKVADKTAGSKPEPSADPNAEKVAAKKVETPAKPVVTPGLDRDPNQEKAKMKRSRQTSAKAKQLLRSGQNDKAITEARNALRDHEQNVEAMLVIAEAFYKQGKHELVLSVTGSILKVDPKVLGPEEKSQAYNLMGFAYLQGGSRGKAFEAFKNAAETDENNSSAWNNLGVQYMWRGEPATAQSCFEYAVSLDAKFAEAHLNLGSAQRANGQLVEAEAAFRTASKLRPDWAEIHFNLGVLYLDAEQIPKHDETAKLDAAIKEFETYKSLVAKGKTSVERSKQKRGPTDAMGNELVSVAQADLYIKAANKGIESEERRQEREAKRKQKQAEAPPEPEAEPASGPESGEPAQPAEKPADPPAQPAEPAKPQTPGQKPAQPAEKPAQPAEKPAKPAEKPAQPAEKPAQPAEKPAQPAEKPAEKPPGPAKPQAPTQNPQSPQKPAPQKPKVLKPGG
ncbi:tetratricopeptide repeat protein [Enhygromyxa salina]|uniref:Lipoprotein NlpI n=1 Tax=Enhygromyxa salina TaxID=215803 RepID=A0A2S9XU08_9BACT|nr:tetratricopeptide repeat protein [Enhygromyxa salina]PRP96345.1 lipoprotein NlpI [Enhygromyxa salina]